MSPGLRLRLELALCWCWGLGRGQGLSGLDRVRGWGKHSSKVLTKTQESVCLCGRETAYEFCLWSDLLHRHYCYGLVWRQSVSLAHTHLYTLTLCWEYKVPLWEMLHHTITNGGSCLSLNFVTLSHTRTHKHTRPDTLTSLVSHQGAKG